MSNKLKLVILILFSVLFLFLFHDYWGNDYLSFSDAAKFADVSRQLRIGEGYSTNFSFFTNLNTPVNDGFSAKWILPGMPMLIMIISYITGMSDMAVIASSALPYLFLVGVTYLLGKKLFSSLVGILSALAIALNVNMLDYATSGASETLFIFLVVAGFYFTSLETNKGNVLAILTVIAMYLTRPQAIIYILVLIIYYLVLNYKNTKNIAKQIFLLFFSFVVLEIIVYLLRPFFPIESVFYRLFVTLGQHASQTGTVGLRTELVSSTSLDLLALSKTAFYNLYNFYRTFGDIFSPYLTTLFLLSIIYFKERKQRLFIFTSVIVVLMTFLSTSLTLPLRRYVHPSMPFVYVPGVAFLVAVILEKMKNKLHASVVALALLSFLVFGQTFGYIFLDSRSLNKSENSDKPPIYVSLSKQLKAISESEDMIITNLDTWGTWYGERKTVWFPLEPQMLANKETGEVPFDAVYLTNYLMDDQNYYMGEEWREIFENPQDHDNEFFSNNYTFRGEYIIPASETYENIEGRAVLFVKK